MSFIMFHIQLDEIYCQICDNVGEVWIKTTMKSERSDIEDKNGACGTAAKSQLLRIT